MQKWPSKNERGSRRMASSNRSGPRLRPSQQIQVLELLEAGKSSTENKITSLLAAKTFPGTLEM